MHARDPAQIIRSSNLCVHVSDRGILLCPIQAACEGARFPRIPHRERQAPGPRGGAAGGPLIRSSGPGYHLPGGPLGCTTPVREWRGAPRPLLPAAVPPLGPHSAADASRWVLWSLAESTALYCSRPALYCSILNASNSAADAPQLVLWGLAVIKGSQCTAHPSCVGIVGPSWDAHIGQ